MRLTHCVGGGYFWLVVDVRVSGMGSGCTCGKGIQTRKLKNKIPGKQILFYSSLKEYCQMARHFATCQRQPTPTALDYTRNHSFASCFQPFISERSFAGAARRDFKASPPGRHLHESTRSGCRDPSINATTCFPMIGKSLNE